MFSSYIVIPFIITFSLLFILRPLAVKYKFVDFPNKRKKHEGNIPLIGGICIFIGALFSQLYANEIDEKINLIFFPSFLMLILGIWDDIVDIKSKKKLLFQILIVSSAIYILDIKLHNLGYLFGLPFQIELGFLSIPFTIIAIIGLTNAFNMIDGIDGLATNLLIISIVGIFVFNLNGASTIFINILIALVSSLIPFLFFNVVFNRNLKIFLGDGGSLFLGFMVSILLIHTVENVNSFTPTFALWCVSIPLFDFFGVVTLRKVNKRSIFTADRDHIHHFLENFGLSKKIVMLLITSVAIVLLFVGYLIEINFPELSFPVFIILFIFYMFMRFYFKVKLKYKDDSVNVNN